MTQPRYSKPSSCAGCSLEKLGFGFVPPSGPLNAQILFLGEAGGGDEAVRGEPFIGAAGGTLTRVLHRVGIDRGHVKIANCISCHPPNDYLIGAPWEQPALAQCRATQLEPILSMLPANGVVVALGATPIKSLLHLHGVEGIAVKDFHGTVQRDPLNRFWVVPTFHPSHLQRGAMNLLEVVTQDLQTAMRVAAHGFTRSPATLVVDPAPEWYANWIAAHLAKLADDPDATPLALDTEFAEKIKGQDESEVTAESLASPLLRVNGAHDRELGWTVPYRQPYIGLTETLLAGIAARQGIVWLWNKYADWEHLKAAGHTLGGIMAIDLMWLWHYLQSDLPRSLGFVAPMASDFGPWKHWAKVKAREGEYAAADGLQTWRVGKWLVDAAIKHHLWEIFIRDWHERDEYVLRPAHDMGVPIDRVELEAFHVELQAKQQRILGRIKETTAAGVLKPKAGYAKRPKGKVCAACEGTGWPPGTCWHCGSRTNADGICQNYGCEGTAATSMIPPCIYCQGSGMLPPTAPASILGKPKKGGGEAKSQYMLEGVQLVERAIEIEIRICTTCGARGVGAKHRCPRASRNRKVVGVGPETGRATGTSRTSSSPAQVPPGAALELARDRQTRYFWQLPFNPDAPQQILAYIASHGETAPEHKKTRKPTTAKDGLKALAKRTDDPFYQLQLDWKAVTKVDATYAVGTLRQMDQHDRVHPEYLPKPSTLRDSCISPNLTNVVADKAGPEGLASGFRRCVVARDGVPPGVSEAEFAAWEAKWIVPSA